MIPRVRFALTVLALAVAGALLAARPGSGEEAPAAAGGTGFDATGVNPAPLAPSPPAPATAPHDGLLHRAERAAQSTQSGTPASATTYDADHKSKTVSSEMAEVAFKVIFFTITSPWWAPHELLKDWYGHPTPGFQAYPFEAEDGFRTPGGRPVAGTVRILYHRLSPEADGWRWEAQGMTRRFSAEWASTAYAERVVGRRDRLAFHEILLLFHFAQGHGWNFRSGLGGEWIRGEALRSSLWKFAYRIQVFVRPVQLGLDLGTSVGPGPTWTEWAPSVSYHRGRIEAGLGYRARGIRGVTLGGPEAGLRVWF